MGYETESGTQLLAVNCLICGKPLRDPESVELGVGPDCADKVLFDLGHGPGNINEADLHTALDAAPESLRSAFERGFDIGGIHKAVSSAVHTTGRAWEERRKDARAYVTSFCEITDAAGYPRMAAAVSRRLSEARLDKDLPSIVESVNKFDQVRLKDGRTGEIFWVGKDKYTGKPKVGFKTGPNASAEWLFFTDLAEVLDKAETQIVSKFLLSDIKPPCRVELTNGQIRDVAKTGTGDRGPWIGLKVKGSRSYDFVYLPDIVEIIYDDPSTRIQPEEVVAPCRVELKDGSIHSVNKTGTTDGKFWIRVDVPGSRNSDFVDLDDVAKVLPAEITKRAPKKRQGAARGEILLDPKLMPHQIEGVEWLANRSGAILADEMGVGKTATAIFAMDLPAIVICPGAVRTNWAREIKFWRPELTVSIVDGKKTDYSADVIVVNFERVKGEAFDALLARGNNTVVIDEAHFLKNLRVYPRGGVPTPSGSQRAISAWKLVYFGGVDNARVEHTYVLTGTPMPNGRHQELFALLNLVAGDETEETASFKEYAEEFCPPQKVYSKGGYNVEGAYSYDENTNAPALNALLKAWMLRRTKAILSLPEKFRQQKFIDMDADSQKSYASAEKEFRAWIRSVGGAEALDRALRAEAIVRLTNLRKLAALGKIEGLTEEIENYLRDTKKPLVLMAHHRDVISALEASLKEAGFRVGRIDGESRDKQAVVDAFQAGKLDVVLCSVTAAGIGITLTAADTLFFAERVWRPFDMLQAEDRIHRIGQKNKATIVYFDAPGTIDEVLSDTMDTKIANANAVLSDDDTEGAEEDSISKSVLKAFR